MTQQEWNTTSDVAAMLQHLTSWGEGTPRAMHPLVSDRKLRLFAAACCRSVWHLLTDPRSRNAVETAERFADGEVTEAGLRAAHQNSSDGFSADYDPAVMLAWLASGSSMKNVMNAADWSILISPTTQAGILRSIVQPFAPMKFVDLPQNWIGNQYLDEGIVTTAMPKSILTPTVIGLATAAYTNRLTTRCETCGGSGRIEIGIHGGPFDGPEKQYIYPPPTDMECLECHGTGRISTGQLDPATLAILADALGDAGCVDPAILNPLRGLVRCAKCQGKGGYASNVMGGKSSSGSYFSVCDCCQGEYWVPDPTPRYRGFWVLDLFLNKG